MTEPKLPTDVVALTAALRAVLHCPQCCSSGYITTPTIFRECDCRINAKRALGEPVFGGRVAHEPCKERCTDYALELEDRLAETRRWSARWKRVACAMWGFVRRQQRGKRRAKHTVWIWDQLARENRKPRKHHVAHADSGANSAVTMAPAAPEHSAGNVPPTEKGDG